VGLVSAILTLPLAPVRAVIWLGEVLRDQVEHELYDPNVIRRQLEEIEEARAAGRMSEEDAARQEQELLSRLIQPSGSGGSTTAGTSE
jgi:cytochrome c-type biogenesis protein CcmH/NrfG